MSDIFYELYIRCFRVISMLNYHESFGEGGVELNRELKRYQFLKNKN